MSVPLLPTPSLYICNCGNRNDSNHSSPSRPGAGGGICPLVLISSDHLEIFQDLLIFSLRWTFASMLQDDFLPFQFKKTYWHWHFSGFHFYRLRSQWSQLALGGTWATSFRECKSQQVLCETQPWIIHSNPRVPYSRSSEWERGKWRLLIEDQNGEVDVLKPFLLSSG